MKNLCVLLLTFFCGSVLAADGHWIGTWAMNPTGLPTVERLGTFKLPPVNYIDGTVRYRLRISQGGTQLRLRFSNEYRDKPLTLRAATVGLAASGLDAVAGSLKTITFGGAAAITIPAGAPALSDAIPLRVTALADLVVSVHVDDLPVNFCPETMPITDQAVVEHTDVTYEERPTNLKCTYLTRPLVSAVNVLVTKRHPVVVTLGDSITDGRIDATTGDRGWPGVLARRLRNTKVSVVNAGIAGNRLLQTMPMFGAAALARFDRDVLSVPGVTHIVLLEGINDIGTSGPGGMFGDTPLVDPKDLIGAYQQIIARAHEHGIKVIGATILPFEGAMYYSAEKEAIRSVVNEWIRTSKQFDGVIDFDAALRDAANPRKLNTAFDSGDHLHPSTAGSIRMGNVIDLSLFK